MSVSATHLRCEHAPAPVGIGERAPRLQWQLEARDGERDVVQHAFRVEVQGLWDSGWIDGSQQLTLYGGPALPSRAKCEWRVQVRTSHGETGWSDTSTFETGLL